MKHVLITGGNKGIGLKTTMLFLSSEYKVTIIARNASALNINHKNLNKVDFDLYNIEKIPTIIAEIGEIDILINNAGIMNKDKYNNYSEINKEKILKINIEAPVQLMTSVSENMITKNSGRIVNVASIAGHIGHPDIWYGITKAGLINSTKSFAKILSKYGIVVNCVAPGPVETEMLSIIPEDRKKQLMENTYLNSFAKPEDIAKTIFWLATESPSYINGTCIDINNGAFPR